MTLPTRWEQLQLLAGLLVAQGEIDKRILRTAAIEYHLERVICLEYEHDLSKYPPRGASNCVANVCGHCGIPIGNVGGYIVESCDRCEYAGGSNRWKYQAQLIEFKAQHKIHRRWAELAIAQAIALRTLNNRSTKHANRQTTGYH